ncbi:hypothetical protein O181_058589 [Austropuccinia psidii MF-1]|uniref:Copia protein n=1 Tax=Austropuccinia psidii MF-1 TaxID=1389203 RepID=A0A9Q3HXT1_9BASI|nr:hypothetical protein [Austropuccinia psidii MF-1]
MSYEQIPYQTNGLQVCFLEWTTQGWKARKQKVVALSSAKAKYNAFTESSQYLAWTKQLILETTNLQVQGTLYSDNLSAIAIASNPVYHHGTRHINFRLHLFRDSLEKQSLKLKYLPTAKMLANMLTKNLPLLKFLPQLKMILSNPELTSTEEY